MAERHTLHNGLELVLEPRDQAAPAVAIQLWVGAGSAHDPPGRSGLAHLLEHLVFKGTRRRSADQIEAAIELRGGEIGASTNLDWTVFQVSIASRFLDAALELLADLALHPRLDAADLEQERGVVLEELRGGAESVIRVHTSQLMALAYGRHAYGRPVIGTARSVRAITADDLRRFHASRYVAGNMTLVVVGDVDPAGVVARARRCFPAGSSGPPAPRLAAALAGPSDQRGLRVSASACRGAGASTRVSLAFRLPEPTHEHLPQLELAALILGEGESSRLARRLGRGGVAACHAQVFSPAGPGLFVVGASGGRVRRVTRALLDEVARLGREEVSPAEVERARRIFEADAALQRQTPQDRAYQLGALFATAGSLEHEPLFLGRVVSATPATIRAAVARHLAPRGLSIAALCPDAGSEVGPDAGPGQGSTVEVVSELKRSALALLARPDGGAVGWRRQRRGQRRGQRGGRAHTAKRTARRNAQRTARRIVKRTLANGARLLVLRDGGLPVASVRAIWQGGQRVERAGTRGASNLLASLLTRGAGDRSGEQLHAAIEALPGSISGCFGENSLGLQLELLARRCEPGLEILADCALEPWLPVDALELARREALEAIHDLAADPAAAAMARFLGARYGDHPYGACLLGDASSVGTITRDGLARYFRRRYGAAGLVVAVVGDVDLERVEAWFERRFGGLPARAGEAPAARIAAPPRRRRPVGVIGLHDTELAHVVVGFPGTTKRGRDRIALELLGALLAERGRLFVELRRRRGLAYQVDHTIFDGIDPGHIAFYVATSPAALPEVLTQILRQLDELRRAPVPAAELEQARRFMVGSHERSLQEAAVLAAHLAYDELYGRGPRAHESYAPALLGLTAARVQRVARRFLARREMVVSLSLPAGTSPAEQEALRALLGAAP